MAKTKPKAAKPATTAANKPVTRAENRPEIGVVPLMGCRCRCGHEWLPEIKTTAQGSVPSAKVQIGTGLKSLKENEPLHLLAQKN